MLTIRHDIPQGLTEIPASQLYQALPGPTLIHLQGRRDPGLFVSVLLHGNETTGYAAIQELLKKYQKQTLPRSLSIFIGNVEAARHGVRRLDSQLDYNRIWKAGTSPEHAMTHQVIEEMRQRGVFASVDIHNNTGLNPHYACVNRIDSRFFHLARLFSRVVVYFIRPAGVQTMAFADLCPAVTLECGKVGERSGLDHALEYLDACLHLSEIPEHPVPEHDLNLFHTVAIMKVPDFCSLGFGEEPADLRFVPQLDHLNFIELPAGTQLGWATPESGARLVVSDEEGRDVGEKFFEYGGGAIHTRVPIMPSMLTLDRTVIRQDCLGYLMERLRPTSPS